MANRSMALDVLVRLRDQLSRPMRSLTNNLQKLTGFARRIGILGTAIAAISFMGPVSEAAAFQQQLLDIAGTAELSGKAAFEFVGKAKAEYEELAFAVGQTSEIIASGAGQMIAAGVDRSLIDATISDIGRAATAANAQFSDMASVGTSMLNTLKLPADQMRDSLGALVIAGKEGSFELKDMAQHFPRLTSQVAKFGVKGREAVNFLGSALQIAMKGTSDPSIAANNLSNFLSKALSERTIKNFSGMGVDIQAVMLDAASKGINPLEAMLQKVGKLTGVGEKEIGKYMQAAKKNGLEGADALAYVREQLEAIGAASKVSELFSDQQVLDFIVPFMANVQEYKDIKEKVAAATGAAIDADFETQMQGMNRQLTILNEIGTQSIREVGFAFGEWLPLINSWLMAGIKWIREFDQSTGGWVKTLMTGAGGAILLVGALGALGLVLPIIGAGLGAIGALIGVIFSPLGIVIGLLAGAGVLIAKNWDKVGPKLMKFWDGLKDRASKAWEGTKRLWGQAQPYLSQVWSRVSDGAVRAWNYVADAAPRAWSRISAGARSIFSNINFDNLKVGSLKVLEGVFNGLQTAWNALKEIGKGIEPSLASIGESLKRTFGHMGDTWNNLKEMGSAIGTIASNLMALVGFDTSKMSGFARTLGEWLGQLEIMKFTGFEKIWQGISALTKGLADLAGWAAGTKAMPDWAKWFPETAGYLVETLADGVEKLWGLLRMPIEIPTLAWDLLASGFDVVKEKIMSGIQAIIDKLQWLVGIMKNIWSGATAQPGDALPNGGSFDGSRDSSQDDYLKGPTINRPAPANSNAPEKRADIGSSTRFAAISAPPQSVNVGGDIRIKVEGPGKVVASSSDNKGVALKTDRGRAVGMA